MVRIRRTRAGGIDSLHARMEEMMDRVLGDVWSVGRPSRGWAPRADIYETPDALHITLEIPGVAREAIEILVEGRLLSVTGSRPQPRASDCLRWHQVEIAHGRFEKIIELPGDVDPDGIHASYRDGFLILRIPRTTSPARTVTIEKG
jgi:HSP20 family protein